MKILIVNSSDFGGAGKACLRLHEGLLQNGVDSNLLLRSKHLNIPNSHTIKQTQKTTSKIYKVKIKLIKFLNELKIFKTNSYTNNRSSKLEMFSYPISNYDITESPLYKDADIINLHWVAGFVDYKSFFKKNTKPVVWTLHDMNPFTGGEHYTEEIIDINANGYPIFRKLTTEEIHEFKKVLDFKEAIFNNVNNLHLVSLCNWMTHEIKKNKVFNRFPIALIPNGVNHEIFSPRDKFFSRELLGLPKNKKIILFVADSIHTTRKGFAFLKKAFEIIDSEDLTLCAIGNGNLNSFKNCIELGPIHDERLMSLAYSAADVFVIPSLMDNLPNTVLESLMCGTPVIGFPVGGIPDMIQDGVNGYLTEDISVESLVKTIHKFLNNSDCFNGKKIRENTLNSYNQKLQSEKYIDLFNSILNKNSLEIK
ncbi:glycosyltransferase [Flavobacterium psychrotolerans]|uniref:Uncharacterized protein n=1 Tax=Flavobacterium psychrotolerans TaxID=2169410 RepID=A0A2U1JGH5_9FLAO|nr:glycosyltransferase [Flavobacterium psychrotolerans]PWA04038.1 hypothetical protein DB895_13095 [Flavobacterium psychrotolerans]